jgi:undecaprenyl-diphosphatase
METWGAVTSPTMFFDILLHVGTLAAVFFVYRKLFASMAVSLWHVLRGQAKLKDESHARLFFLALVATLPTGLIAIAFGDSMEDFASSTSFVGAMLLVNGVLLLALGVLQRRQAEGEGRTLEEMNLKDALVIGTIQGFGIFRGISRSGATITAALGLGLRQDAAAAFSFVMAVPAILGALAMKAPEASASGIETHVFLGGALAAAIVGTLALIALLNLLKRGKLHHFAWYCFALGAAAIIGT